MSPERRVSPFTPAVISSSSTRTTTDPSHAAGYSAGWVAGSRAAAEAAQVDRLRLEAEHEDREAARDAALAQALNSLGQAIAQWHARALPVLDDAQRSVYEAALDLAEAVLQREIAPGPDSARSLLTRALDVPADVHPTVLRLHPDDLLHVNLLVQSGEADVPHGLVLIPDPRLTPGDAITEHAEGALDARISTALARAREVLLGEPT